MKLSVACLLACLPVGLLAGLVVWLFGCLVVFGWLFGCLVVWLVGWLVGDY